MGLPPSSKGSFQVRVTELLSYLLISTCFGSPGGSEGRCGGGVEMDIEIRGNSGGSGGGGRWWKVVRVFKNDGSGKNSNS